MSDMSAEQSNSRRCADGMWAGEKAQVALGTEQHAYVRELYEKHFARLVRVARRALPAGEGWNAEDLVQTVFVEAIRASAKRPDSRLGEGWLTTRLRSRIADGYRQRRRDRRRETVARVDYQVRLEEMASGHGSTPEDQATHHVYVEELLKTIQDSGDRATLALKLRDYSEREIAVLLNFSYETRQVRDRMARVRARLRAWEAQAGSGGTSN